MSTSGDGDKAPQSGLVDMGVISFYDEPGILPLFAVGDLAPFPGSFSEMVLNLTWAQLQPVAGGPIDPSSVIAGAIQAIENYNAANGTNVGIKLRVWGGNTAPDWAKNIDGPPITTTGQSSVDQNFTPETIGRFWTADYIDAWTSFQNELAAAYGSNPTIRGISNTAGASATDEPFVPVKISAQASPSGGTVNQIAELQAGGYTDASQMLTLRASIADYAQWSTTPLDYTMNLFHLYDTLGKDIGDANFTLSVLQQAQGSAHLVQAGNHALNNPLSSFDAFVYAQMAAYAALDPATAPGSYQTASPSNLAKNQNPGDAYPAFMGTTYADWPYAVANGVAANGGDIELWDFPQPPPGSTAPGGFLGLSAGQVTDLATIVAAGTPPTTGAPDDGLALGFIAPAFATGAANTVAFSGFDAVLLESAIAQNAYTVTLTSLEGGTLAVTDFYGIASGSTSGPTLTLSGPLSEVNTVLASLTDTLQSGKDIVQIQATDSGGNNASRTVGVEVSPPAASSDPGTAGGGPSTNPAAAASGILVVGGVQDSLVVPGDLEIGDGDADTTLLAALAPSAYSTASLSIGGTLEVSSGGAAHFTGSLGAGAITIDDGGAISGDGTVAASDGTILNDGTIEAAADQTLGLQQLTVTNALSGIGELVIDPGASLILGGAVGAQQTVDFSPNSIAQFSNDPYSPSTLELEQPHGMLGTIVGFSFADSLVLDGVAAIGARYDSTTGMLTVDELSGGPLSFALSGSLAGLTPVTSITGSGASSQSTISFVAPPSGVIPRVVAPATLQGAAGAPVLVPDIVLETPFPASLSVDMTIVVTLVAGTGTLSAVDGNGITSIGAAITLSGTLGSVEQSLQTLAYTGAAEQSTDTIAISVSDYADISATPTVISVFNNSAPLQFDWTAIAGGSFDEPGNWKKPGGGDEQTPPGGTNVAAFGPGTYSVSGDGAVGQILATGTTTLTGQVSARGRSGVAVMVDGGGALTLVGGALLTAQEQATVGGSGQGLLSLMGGALALAGTFAPNALVIGENAGSNGTVLNLEEITAAGTVIVGEAGTGTLELLGVASTVSDGGADIGQSAGAQGAATVNGGEWATSGQLTIGDAGDGSLSIDGTDNGITGQVTAFDATIGAQAGSQGSATLDGGDLLIANATATSSTLIVGAGGTGSLTIEDGGDVTVGVAEATVAGTNNIDLIVDDNGLLLVGGTAGGSGLIRILRNGALMVCGNATVGGAVGTGVGEVTVGGSTDDSALFAATGTLAIDGTGQMMLGGADATVRASVVDIAAGGLVSGSGTLSGDGGGNDTVTLASIDNDGLITASGGNLLLYGGVAGTGRLSVATGATITLQAAVGAGQTLAFNPNAQAVLDDPGAFASKITGFGTGDVLDLASMDATAATWSDNVLTLDTATGAIRLHVAGSYAPDAFTVQADGHGGTDVRLATGSGHGDVHMTTFDGLHYDFQAVGQFVAVRSTEPGNPLQIQIQTEPYKAAASVTTELAATLGDSRVTFAAGRPNAVYIDEMPDTTLHIGGVQSLTGGTLTQLSSTAYQLIWGAGESVTVTAQHAYLDWSVSLGPDDGPGSVQGLLGSDSGRATDFQLPNGSVIPQPLSSEEILGGFADAWRVASGSSLFDDTSMPALPVMAMPPTAPQFISAAGAVAIVGSSIPTNAASSQPAGDLSAAFTPSPLFGT